MPQAERDELLAAVLAAIADVRRDTPSAAEFNDLKDDVVGLRERFDSVRDTIEEIRRNSKGANTWGKVGAAAAPIAVALIPTLLKQLGVL